MIPSRRLGQTFGLTAAITGGAVFAASIAYFVWRYATAFGHDAGVWRPDGWRPAAIDALLFSVFALHHSLFARAGLRRAIERRVPAAFERTTYVWIASVLFVATCACWQPVPGAVWHASGVLGRVLRVAPLAGVIITLVAARRLDVLDLAGIRQASGTARATPVLLRSGLYRVVRHPIYFGWLLIVWPVADLTGTRLVFAAVSTLYLVVAIPFEERDLRRTFGAAYDDYARHVRWRLVPGVY